MAGEAVTSRRPAAIIAEAAQGFEGDPTLARLLVRASASGGADMVKFQLVVADELATPDYPYYGLFKKLEMPFDAWQGVAGEARRLGRGLVFDVYGAGSLRTALALGADAVKIHATDFFNDALVDGALRDAPKVLFSVGGILIEEVAGFLARCGTGALGKLTLLYGFQSEPTATSDNNLWRLTTLRERFPGLELGFMDHAEGGSDEASWLSLLALPFGVTVIEKHITLDRSLELEDSVSALSPGEFASYVRRVRAAESALGSGDLTLTAAELGYRDRAIKVVVARQALTAGGRVRESDVALLRTPREDGGQPLHRIRDVVGQTVARPVAPGRPVYREDLA